MATTIEKLSNNNVTITNSNTGECLVFPSTTKPKILPNGNILLEKDSPYEKYELFVQSVTTTISAAGTTLYTKPVDTKTLFEDLYTNFFFLASAGGGLIYTEVYFSVLPTPSGPDLGNWVVRNTPYIDKLILIHIQSFQIAQGQRQGGVRTIGSVVNRFVSESSFGAVSYAAKTNSNGDFEIYSNSNFLSFRVYAILE